MRWTSGFRAIDDLPLVHWDATDFRLYGDFKCSSNIKPKSSKTDKVGIRGDSKEYPQHIVGHNTNCHICNFAKNFFRHWTVWSVPTSSCSDTCPPSLSETRVNAGQSWQKDKMLYLKQGPKWSYWMPYLQPKRLFIFFHIESNTSCLEMIWKVMFSWVFNENTILYRRLQLKKTINTKCRIWTKTQ